MMGLLSHGSRICARTALLAGLAFAAVAGSSEQAAAQGSFFDALFGRRASPGPSASAYADPFHWNPFASRNPEAPRGEGGGSAAFCVRLCDGRYFPIPRNMGVAAAQTSAPSARPRIPRSIMAAASSTRSPPMGSAMPNLPPPSSTASKSSPIAPATVRTHLGSSARRSMTTLPCGPAISSPPKPG